MYKRQLQIDLTLAFDRLQVGAFPRLLQQVKAEQRPLFTLQPLHLHHGQAATIDSKTVPELDAVCGAKGMDLQMDALPRSLNPTHLARFGYDSREHGLKLADAQTMRKPGFALSKHLKKAMLE